MTSSTRSYLLESECEYFLNVTIFSAMPRQGHGLGNVNLFWGLEGLSSTGPKG